MQCVLSDRDIVAERLNGNIVISPFDTDSLSNCSYDVKLGEWFYRNEKSLNYFNPWNRDDVAAYWGNPINAADCPCNRDYLRTAKDYEGVPTLSSKNIIVHPGETILAHTQEFIGGRNHITTMMKTRSSLGRSCIATCKCAGWGDIGYVNRWTMEITNVSTSSSVVLPVGARVAQIIFMYSGEPTRAYYGKYQSKWGALSCLNEEEVVEMLSKEWTPKSMLPKLWKDYSKDSDE